MAKVIRLAPVLSECARDGLTRRHEGFRGGRWETVLSESVSGSESRESWSSWRLCS